MSPGRRCSRTACDRLAVATLTYNYSDQTAVLGPLATYAEPHGYDLCEGHAAKLSAPRGWDVIRLADAVREAAHRRPPAEPATAPPADEGGDGVPTVRRGHLRMLRTLD